jgi:HEAT repeat protein
MRINRYFIGLWIASIFVIFTIRVESAQIQNIQSNFDNLLNTIKTGNAYQKARAIAPFSQIDDKRVVPVLIDLLEDEDNEVRFNAAQRLAYIADERSTEALVKALNDPYGQVRRNAAIGISNIGKEEYVPDLVSSIIKNLANINKSGPERFYAASAFTAIGKLSSTSPPEILQLLNKIDDANIMYDSNWWDLLRNVVNCLSSIGDKSAYQSLKKAQQSLESKYQDYRTWYSVRKALAAIEPEKEPFNQPATEILINNSMVQLTNEQKNNILIFPLVELGEGAIEDLSWALKFKSHDLSYNGTAIEALGEIGGEKSTAVLGEYLESRSQLSDRQLSEQSYNIRKALVALVKMNPDTNMTEKIAKYSQYSTTTFLLNEIFALRELSIQTKIAYLETIIQSIKGSPRTVIPRKQQMISNAAKLIGQQGGQDAGEYLSRILFDSSYDSRVKTAVLEALGTIEDYDSIPTLIEASTIIHNSSVDAVNAFVKAMGIIADTRAIPVLKQMEVQQNINTEKRLWIAATLARLDVNYTENAKLVRDALPVSLEQATLLKDEETIAAVAAIIAEGQTDAIKTLTAIGTDYALKALTAKIDLEKMTNPRYQKDLCYAALNMAEALGDESAKQYYQELTHIINEVTQWFVTSAAEEPIPADRGNYITMTSHPQLVRKIWIAEANRQMNNSSQIIFEALSVISDFFDQELIPVMERFVTEDSYKQNYHGKDSSIPFYSRRSSVAQILTEKTGRTYTFIDVDGRTHPGGWNPSQDN